FCGSGTVLVESLALGRDALGIDVLPLARLISQVKTTAGKADDLVNAGLHVLARAKRLRDSAPPPSPLAFWFKPEVLRCLIRLSRAVQHHPDDAVRRFLQVSLSSTVR